VTDASAGTRTYPIAARGDVSGDGAISLLDLLMIQKYLLGTHTLEAANLLAGDVDSDGAVKLLDLLRVQKHLLGTQLIS